MELEQRMDQEMLHALTDDHEGDQEQRHDPRPADVREPGQLDHLGVRAVDLRSVERAQGLDRGEEARKIGSSGLDRPWASNRSDTAR